MADKQYPSVKFNTPVVPFLFTALDKPVSWSDAEKKYLPDPAGDYFVKFRVASAEDIGADVVQQLTALRDSKFAEVQQSLRDSGNGLALKKLSRADVLPPEMDKRTGEPTGAFVLNAKMQASGISKKTKEPWSRKPDVFNADGNAHTGRVYGGSEGIVAIEARPYYVGGTGVVGVSFKLQAVQVTKLVDGSGPRPASSYGFQKQATTQTEREPGSDDAQGEDDIPY